MFSSLFGMQPWVTLQCTRELLMELLTAIYCVWLTFLYLLVLSIDSYEVMIQVSNRSISWILCRGHSCRGVKLYQTVEYKTINWWAHFCQINIWHDTYVKLACIHMYMQILMSLLNIPHIHYCTSRPRRTANIDTFRPHSLGTIWTHLQAPIFLPILLTFY